MTVTEGQRAMILATLRNAGYEVMPLKGIFDAVTAHVPTSVFPGLRAAAVLVDTTPT